MKLAHVLLSVAVASCMFTPPVRADQLYLKSGNSDVFARYDTATNAWTPLTGFDAQSQLATDANGALYAIHTGVGVRKYSPEADTWTTIAPMPPLIEGIGYDFNLEVANDGTLLVTEPYSIRLQRFSGGTWTGTTYSFDFGGPGDYDHATGTFAAGRTSVSAFVVIDLATTAATHYSNGSVIQGEHRRFGEVLNGRFYVAGYQSFLSYDLSNPSAGPVAETQLPSNGNYYPAGAADPTTGTLFVATFGNSYASNGDNFFRYNPTTDVYTALADFPTAQFSYDNSIAFVAIPEPTSPCLVAITALTLIRRRQLREQPALECA